MLKIYFLVLSFILSQSCGIKGPPLPPLNPETIQKQKTESNEVSPNQKTKKKPNQ